MRTDIATRKGQGLGGGRCVGQAAFTMVEIAIALAVIAFALVAIIGILPTGLNVQKENLADTIINQDGAYFLEAIKSGAQGLDDLTNSVEKITLHDGTVIAGKDLRSGLEIIGLLSYPIGKDNEATTAIIRALSGSAAEKGPNEEVREIAFKYQLEIRITNFPTTPHDIHHTIEVRNELQKKLYEIRLEFRWPLLANGKDTGNGLRVFRALVSGDLVLKKVGNQDLYFFQQ